MLTRLLAPALASLALACAPGGDGDTDSPAVPTPAPTGDTAASTADTGDTPTAGATGETGPATGSTASTTADTGSATADTGSTTADTGSATADTGSATADTATPSPRVKVFLHGGGSESDEVYQRFVDAVGPGEIVTLGSVPASDPYRDWWDSYFTKLGATQARTINTNSRAEADDPKVVGDLASAAGVYIRGGDQARYLTYWEGTVLHDELQAAIDGGAVVGGSSAGCAILGERVYDARVSSVAPYDVLDDAQHPGMTFTDDFLDLLPGVITDTHFTERGRLGRLLVFQQQWKADGVDGLAIGVDPRTALLVADDGSAEVVGEGAVTLLDARSSTATLPAGSPPDIRDVRWWNLPAGYHVDLNDLDDPVQVRPAYVQATPTPATPTGWASLQLQGGNGGQRSLGSWWLSNLGSDPWAWFYGALQLDPGTDDLPQAVVLTALWADSDYFENHQGGLGWALSLHPELVAIGVDVTNTVDVAPPATVSPVGDSYALIIDGRSMGWSGFADDGGWQRGALEGATIHVVGPGTTWSP